MVEKLAAEAAAQALKPNGGTVGALLRQYGLATLLALLLTASLVYDKYVWNTQLLDNQRTITTQLAGAQAAIERGKETHQNSQETVRLLAVSIDAQRQQAQLLERLVTRVEALERQHPPPR